MASEQRAFVFAVAFIVIFSGLLSTVPVDLLGSGATPDTPFTPVNPNLLSDFSDSRSFHKTDFVDFTYWYNDLGGYDWGCGFIIDSFYVAAKALFFGLWFGAMSAVDFTNDNGTLYYGGGISFTDIANDATDGAVRYTLTFQADGNSAGGFLFYWNTTTYANPSDAWDADALYLLHGFGITPNTNVASLLLGLLFLQLPDVPFLVNLLIATPLWASIGYVIWFIIKEMIPFLG